MQVTTIAPAPRACASRTQSRVERPLARMRRASPVYWYTMKACTPAAWWGAPGARWLSTPTTTHCEPKRLASSSMRSGFSSAGELIEILSAPASRIASASATERMPPATQNGISRSAVTRWIQARSTERRPRLAGGAVELGVRTEEGAIARNVGAQHVPQTRRRVTLDGVPEADVGVRGPAARAHPRVGGRVHAHVESEHDALGAKALEPGRDVARALERCAADDYAADAGIEEIPDLGGGAHAASHLETKRRGSRPG